ncbi:MAG: hypothetical protein HY297_04225 [Thaumarchaeota archaeon]|nr:hypothetical protein [Nitrososphaerota archaeon]
MFDVAPLLFGAAVVGVFHMSAPDHWVTLVILGRASGWSRAKLLYVGLATASGHVLLSVVLGIGIVLFGLVISSAAASYLAEGTGIVMIVIGLGYASVQLRTTAEVDYEGQARTQAEKMKGSTGKGIRYFAVLGAALSPDLSILPIFLVAVPIGLDLALEVSAVFAVSSVLALSMFVLLGWAGLSKVFQRIPPKYNDALVGLTIATVGVYVLVAG